jgi:hypothetical protein
VDAGADSSIVLMFPEAGPAMDSGPPPADASDEGDAAVDAGDVSSGWTPVLKSRGCGCRAAGRGPGRFGSALALGLAALIRGRRRRRLERR